VLVELRALMGAEGVLDRQFVQSEFFGEFDEFGLRCPKKSTQTTVSVRWRYSETSATGKSAASRTPLQ